MVLAAIALWGKARLNLAPKHIWYSIMPSDLKAIDKCVGLVWGMERWVSLGHGIEVLRERAKVTQTSLRAVKTSTINL